MGQQLRRNNKWSDLLNKWTNLHNKWSDLHNSFEVTASGRTCITNLTNLQQKTMPEKKKRRLTTVCTICNGPSASHLHYGAIACYSCRAFFRRGIGKSYCCVEGTGDCTIDWSNRRSCQWCRFDRCLKAGMKPELVDAAFRRKSFRKKAAGMGSEDPGFIENLHALDKDDISEFFQDISGGSTLNLSQTLATGENIHSMDSVDLGFLGNSHQPDYLSYMSPSYSMS